MSCHLASLFVVLFLILATVSPAAATSAAIQPSAGDPGVPTISASPQVLQRTWDHVTTLTLTNGLPGHRGYFSAWEMQIECWTNHHRDTVALNQIVVTVDNSGRASVPDCFTFNSGDDPITFFDINLGRKLPASTILRVYDHPPVPQPPPTGDPSIVQVTSDYPFGGHYLQGVSLPNTVRASVDFKGQFGYVKFILNGVEHRVERSDRGVFSYTLNLGQDLRLGPNTLRTIAYNTSTGQASQPEDHMFLGLPSMKWLSGIKILSDFRMQGSGADSAYVAQAEFPVNGFQFRAPGFITPDQNNQTELGLRMTGSITVPTICQAGHPIVLEGRVTDALQHRLYILNLKGNLGASGRIIQQFVDCSIFDPQLEGKVNASAALAADAGGSVYSVVKDLMGTFWALVSGLVAVGDIGVSGKLNTNLGADAKAEATPPYFQAKAGADGQLDLKGTARIFFGPGWSLEFEDYFGGAGSVIYASPGYMGDFKDLYFKTAYGHNMHIILSSWWGAERDYDKTFEVQCDYPLVGEKSCVGKSHNAGANRWLPNGWTPHGAAADYALMARAAGDRQPLASAAAELIAGAPITSALATGVYTSTRLALAINPANSQALLLWTHDDVHKPVGRSHEIYYSRWDGARWQAAAPVTANDLLDEAAQVAWTGDGRAVALWHQLTAAQPRSGPLATAASKLELMTATYDPQADRWSAPQPLTANARFEAAAPFARNTAGDLLAVWAENDGAVMPEALSGQLSDLRAAFHDGGWGAPQMVAAGIPGLAEIAAAYDHDAAAIAFTRVITSTSDAAPIRELYVTTWDGTAWSAPKPESNAGQDHASPNIWFGADSNPVIGWQTGSVFNTRDLTTGARGEIPLAGNGGVDRLQVLPQPDGNLAIVGRQVGDDQNLQTVYFDQATGLTSQPRQLSGGAALAGSYAAALGPDGRLVTAYAQTHMEEQPASMTLSTGEVISFTVPSPGRTDLVVSGYRFSRNLTVNAHGMQMVSGDPRPGAVVPGNAEVQNTGDLPVSDVVVRFYDGNPQTTGIVFGEDVIHQPLAGGKSATVQVAYMVPTEAGIRELYVVVDPENRISEADKRDNVASQTVLGPDLAITAAEAQPDLGDQVLLHTQVRNLGASSTHTTTLAYHWPDLASSAQMTATVPPLSVGEAVTLTLPWHFGDLAAGDHLLVADVNKGDFPELNLTNNVVTVTLGVQPDLAISPNDLVVGDVGRAPVPITLTVHNLGVITATNVLVGVYDRWQVDASAQVFTRTIPLLGPGAEAVVTGVMARPAICGVFAWVDPENKITENKENNLASRLGVLEHCAAQRYLPMVLR